jgi:hypothetical protein
MAVYTRKFMMLCFALRKVFACISMTAHTKRRRNIFPVFDHHGHVGLVTTQTLLITHFFCMAFMTLCALQRLGMDKMAFLAVQCPMFTRMSLHLLTLVTVAGETGLLCIVNPGKIYLHRIMRMVAGLAAFNSIVFSVFRRMAHRT